MQQQMCQKYLPFFVVVCDVCLKLNPVQPISPGTKSCSFHMGLLLNMTTTTNNNNKCIVFPLLGGWFYIIES
jgi:hypothetical protein